MGFLDRLLGRNNQSERWPQEPQVRGGYGRQQRTPSDEQALERYRYMLQTAPPEEIEQAHAEEFARLTPEQRRMALQELANVVPEQERAALNRGGDDPRNLARMATRAEMRQPGILERAFGGRGMGGGMGSMGGGMGMGMGMGGVLAGSLLASVAGSFIGTAIAQEFFDNDTSFDGGEYADQNYEGGEATDAQAGDYGGTEEYGSTDTGGDFGGGEF